MIAQALEPNRPAMVAGKADFPDLTPLVFLGVYLVLWSRPLFFVHRERPGSRKNIAFNYVAIYVVPNTLAMPLAVIGYAHFGGFFHGKSGTREIGDRPRFRQTDKR